ncbi:hypothetical protein Pmani_035673 [Petrolisthes manimaculis]|uniref:Uncharacterized protein n=1 Tax=Petrolisthes manimaculis TaxID=1843537 RepID=A0AAE1TN72_9EUCA|nr:hypothetical protein Pmani_035673 [Petrolisthes manimaculis]
MGWRGRVEVWLGCGGMEKDEVERKGGGVVGVWWGGRSGSGVEVWLGWDGGMRKSGVGLSCVTECLVSHKTTGLLTLYAGRGRKRWGKGGGRGGKRWWEGKEKVVGGEGKGGGRGRKRWWEVKER